MERVQVDAPQFREDAAVPSSLFQFTFHWYATQIVDRDNANRMPLRGC